MTNKIKIFMIDDHKMIIDGIIQILSKYCEFDIIGFALSGRSALREAQKYSNIDIFIVDINLPDVDGLIIIKSLMMSHPKSKFIVLSMHNNKNIIKNSFQAGIMGYVLKNSGENELVESIKTVFDGRKYLSKDAMSNFVEGLKDNEIIIKEPVLSDREISVAKLYAKGLTAVEIADILFISNRTVETHRRNVMHKLQLKNSSELFQYAVQAGWINIEK